MEEPEDKMLEIVDSDSNNNTVSLDANNHEGEKDETEESSWWKRLLDIEEAKKQILFSLPIILTNVSYYLIFLVSVMFAGRLGELELAGVTLANSWAYITGFSCMTGLSGALETLCGQGYGAKMYRILGIYLQASCIISFIFCLIISIAWFYTEPILFLLHQDPVISKTAALYIRFLIPGLFAYGFLQNILRFLQTQSAVTPLLIFSLLPLIIHIGIAHTLVNRTSLGFKGASIAASISLWIAFLVLSLYVIKAKRFEHTWEGFSLESFSYILKNLKLALPSAAMLCLEEWAFEILVFLSGLTPNSETNTSLIAICVNTQTIAYMIVYGLGAGVSTRVSNELGAGNPGRARNAISVTLKLSVLLGLIAVLEVLCGHDIWVGLFTHSPVIKEKFASMTPLLAISLLVDAVQGVLSGVARGCGWQYLGVYVNLVTFYFIGVTTAAIVGFKMKLYAKGLWIGLICGLSCQTVALFFITVCSKWSNIELRDNKDKENPLLVELSS